MSYVIAAVPVVPLCAEIIEGGKTGSIGAGTRKDGLLRCRLSVDDSAAKM